MLEAPVVHSLFTKNTLNSLLTTLRYIIPGRQAVPHDCWDPEPQRWRDKKTRYSPHVSRGSHPSISKLRDRPTTEGRSPVGLPGEKKKTKKKRESLTTQNEKKRKKLTEPEQKGRKEIARGHSQPTGITLVKKNKKKSKKTKERGKENKRKETDSVRNDSSPRSFDNRRRRRWRGFGSVLDLPGGDPRPIGGSGPGCPRPRI